MNNWESKIRNLQYLICFLILSANEFDMYLKSVPNESAAFNWCRTHSSQISLCIGHISWVWYFSKVLFINGTIQFSCSLQNCVFLTTPPSCQVPSKIIQPFLPCDTKYIEHRIHRNKNWLINDKWISLYFYEFTVHKQLIGVNYRCIIIPTICY